MSCENRFQGFLQSINRRRCNHMKPAKCHGLIALQPLNWLADLWQWNKKLKYVNFWSLHNKTALFLSFFKLAKVMSVLNIFAISFSSAKSKCFAWLSVWWGKRVIIDGPKKIPTWILRLLWNFDEKSFHATSIDHKFGKFYYGFVCLFPRSSTKFMTMTNNEKLL